ncbi:helix-hairpin-helix domain-containing protein [Haliovirga abyssi]|uniref:Helix-hairpin-helix domain-containing protein n=1 Tax=Haliovirga abyssi TaxID=2996794 RepID=A0AAU9DBT2_9FUSO|nr:helix-hairpin-helix domain-containing protein [Haliovirga abyssi]BDU49727.1 hypothetical protein HLVA_02960 [Haliovirga abyssi]
MKENNKKLLYIIILILIGAIGLKFFENKSDEKDINIRKLKTYKVDYHKKFNKGKLDINKVSEKELIDRGMSEKMAYNIIKYRGIVGNILKIDELTRVKGIGVKRVEKLRDIIFVDNKDLKPKMININKVNEEALKYFGFSKKEIGNIIKWRKNNGSIYSNMDLIEIIGEKRYYEISDRVDYLE